jgi:hypothetical protein
MCPFGLLSPSPVTPGQFRVTLIPTRDSRILPWRGAAPQWPVTVPTGRGPGPGPGPGVRPSLSSESPSASRFRTYRFPGAGVLVLVAY